MWLGMCMQSVQFLYFKGRVASMRGDIDKVSCLFSLSVPSMWCVVHSVAVCCTLCCYIAKNSEFCVRTYYSCRGYLAVQADFLINLLDHTKKKIFTVYCCCFFTVYCLYIIVANLQKLIKVISSCKNNGTVTDSVPYKSAYILY